MIDRAQEKVPFRVTGRVSFAGGIPAAGIEVKAFDLDFRHEEELGRDTTNERGSYCIVYSADKFCRQERGSADLLLKAFDADGSLVVSSDIVFNAPVRTEVDLIISSQTREPPALFVRIEVALKKLLGSVHVDDLEEDQKHHDLRFLCGETGFQQRDLARFVLAHRLAAAHDIHAHFWFSLLKGALFAYAETESLKQNTARVIDALPFVDALAAERALANAVRSGEIPQPGERKIQAWVGAFGQNVVAQITLGPSELGPSESPTFTRRVLAHAGIADAAKGARFAHLLQQHRGPTPALFTALEADRGFKKAEIADLRTSYQLAELLQSDFSGVQVLKEAFKLRKPEQIRTLAQQPLDTWVELFVRKQQAGELVPPLGFASPEGAVEVPEAELFAKTFDQKLREAFPTDAFTGDLERALSGGTVRGLRHARLLARTIKQNPELDLQHTFLDGFLAGALDDTREAPATTTALRSELKAVQRIFKLAPTFAATDTLLADGVHAARQVYRLGESEFVRRYGTRSGFTPTTARLAWRRAANTHAAALTLLGDVTGIAQAAPAVLGAPANVTTFPNVHNLFQLGDTCHCEHCRSALSPAAYFTDLLLYLGDRASLRPKTGGGFHPVRDILLDRRADLGYLELSCENALRTLPYVDVVCEVLERAVDAAGSDDVQLPALTSIPGDAAAAKASVAGALDAAGVDVGDDFILSQVDPADPERWVVHGDAATFLLQKKGGASYVARLLPNTKASSKELRAHPAYINAEAYKKLRGAQYPLAVPLTSFAPGDPRREQQRHRGFTLPFDLFAEEVRASCQKLNLRRWDLMRTYRGPAGPNNPSDGDIAAESLASAVIRRPPPTKSASSWSQTPRWLDSRPSGERAATRLGGIRWQIPPRRWPTSARFCARRGSTTTSCWR